MGDGGSRTLGRSLAELDGETFARFVGDVWRARGADASIDGTDVVVTHGDGTATQVLRTVHWRRRFPIRVAVAAGLVEVASADVIVTSREHDRLRSFAAAHETGYIGPDRLRKILLYAVDPADRETLLRSYFGSSNEVIGRSASGPDPSTPGTERVLALVGRGRRPGRRSFVFLAVLLAALLCVGILGGFAPVDDARWAPADRPESFLATSEPTTPPPAIEATREGAISPLITRHTAAVRSASIELTIGHANARGTFVTQGRWRRSRQTIRVDPDGRYHVTVDGDLEPATLGASTRRVGFRVGGNDTTCTGTVHSGASHQSDPDPCRIVGHPGGGHLAATVTGRYTRRYLNGTNPLVRPLDDDFAGAYRLESTDPPPDLRGHPRNYGAVAVVDDEGVVRYLEVSYDTPLLPETDTVHFVFRIEYRSTN